MRSLAASRREYTFNRHHPRMRVIRYSKTLMVESRGRGLLNTPRARSMTVVGWTKRLLRRLLAQLSHILRRELRCLAAEARGHVIGNRRDLGVGIGIAERTHRDRGLLRMPPGSGNHDLRDIR